ncbi:copper type II ascorbate-dependent monooxygenase domain protein [Oesophagostomum dentatum]|uniref:Copper type II ascorbate-dependent monooxygenase domain protein n=1 Tax=Oesophagostomum dentatum TaxID=61180 RepID=A0A0B1TEQ2_OESDE|nr:copper type II ascorbate-dependent monooxygenase domain protein [Oesophagostomum dentatum]
MFAPVQNQSLVVQQGDMLAARCILKNDEDRLIKMGPTGEDEMCNFYMMYWAEGDKVLKDNTCFSPGAPFYHWATEGGLNHIPK